MIRSRSFRTIFKLGACSVGWRSAPEAYRRLFPGHHHLRVRRRRTRMTMMMMRLSSFPLSNKQNYWMENLINKTFFSSKFDFWNYLKNTKQKASSPRPNWANASSWSISSWSRSVLARFWCSTRNARNRLYFTHHYRRLSIGDYRNFLLPAI